MRGGSGGLWNDWSAAAFACGDVRRAEEGFRKALAVDPRDSQAAANLGTVLAAAGRSGEAAEFLERAIAGCEETQRGTIVELLEACRFRMCEQAVSASQAEFRELLADVPGEPPAAESRAPSEPHEPDSGDYWFPEITGWFSCREALHLYTVVKLARPRRILEIGTFYGRSTATICAAIQGLPGRPAVQFTSIDLDLCSEQEARRIFGQIHHIDSAVVTLPPEYEEAFALGLSTTGYAHRQLEQRGLRHLVKLASGDFRKLRGRFDLIFADVLHEEHEIRRNLRDILHKLEPGGILAAHDLNNENKGLMEELGGEAEFISRSGTLGIYRIGGRAARARNRRIGEHHLAAKREKRR